MYKMIIVDDEQYTRDGMKKILPWESYNIDIVAVCTGAEEGIAAARELKPDIIITDIKMKNTDGLSMCETIKGFLKCQFIVISGYSVFEYAQRAIKAEVSSYLLKPVPRVELEAAVVKCIMRIDRDRMGNVAESLGNSEYAVDILVNGEVDADDLLPFSEYMLAVVKYPQPVVKSYEDKMHIFERLNQIYGKAFVLFSKADEMILIASAESDDGKIGYHFDADCHIGVCMRKNGHKFSDVYKNAQTALLQTLREGKNVCIFGDDTVVYMNDFYTDAYKNVMMLLEDGEIQVAKREIQKCFSRARTDKVLYTDIKAWAQKLFSAIRDYIRKNDADPELVKGFEQKFREMTRADDTFDFAVSDCLLGLCDLYDSERDTGDAADANEKIREIVEYVNEHFTENISLDSLSKMFWLEKKYLSKVFKKYVNENYVEYVTGLRIEASKKLLEDNRYTISEVAEQVSYNDANYFAVLFKKNVGMTPKEYRLKYMK